MARMQRHGLWLVLVPLALLTACGSADVGSSESPNTAAEQSRAVSSAESGSTEELVGDSATEPAATEPAAVDEPQGITAIVSSTYVDYPDIAHLAWTSSSIVLGEVVEEMKAQRLDVDDPVQAADPQLGNSNDDQIYTDFIVRIDKHYRGLEQDTVTLRMLGGTVDDVTVIHESVPDLSVGDEVALFLEPQAAIFDGDTLILNGGPQGLWWVKNGTVEPANPGPVNEPVSINDFEAVLADALRKPPPADMTLADGTITYIPIDAAPPGVDLPVLTE